MKKLVFSILITVLFLALTTAIAKGVGVKIDDETSPSSDLKIAILPFMVTGARDQTKAMLPELYKTVFETKGFDVTMGVPVERAMAKLNIAAGTKPTNKELLRLGENLGVDYVLFASHKFDTKRIWVNLLPRARSWLTLDPIIVDVNAREIVYCPKDKIGYAHGGSDAQIGVGLIIFYPAALFMGGSQSKVERQTAESTIKTAYTQFFESLIKEQNTKVKIQ